VNAPPNGTVIPNGSSLNVGITFTPTALGLIEAILKVNWSNGAAGTSTSVLYGTGAPAQSPVSIEEIISFFDSAVADQSLSGAGAGNSAAHRLNALRNMLLVAGTLIERGEYESACKKLRTAFLKCDQFAQGDSLAALKGMISELLMNLGCM